MQKKTNERMRIMNLNFSFLSKYWPMFVRGAGTTLILSFFTVLIGLIIGVLLALLRRDGYDPLKFFTASHIHPSEQNAKAIAPFYEGISEQTALEARKGMISGHRLLQASNPVKRWVVLTGMKVVGKYDMLHGLVADPQPNPKCVESGKRLEELYAQALPLAETLILEFVAKLDTDQPLSKAYDHTFGEF